MWMFLFRFVFFKFRNQTVTCTNIWISLVRFCSTAAGTGGGNTWVFTTVAAFLGVNLGEAVITRQRCFFLYQVDNDQKIIQCEGQFTRSFSRVEESYLIEKSERSPEREFSLRDLKTVAWSEQISIYSKNEDSSSYTTTGEGGGGTFNLYKCKSFFFSFFLFVDFKVCTILHNSGNSVAVTSYWHSSCHPRKRPHPAAGRCVDHRFNPPRWREGKRYPVKITPCHLGLQKKKKKSDLFFHVCLCIMLYSWGQGNHWEAADSSLFPAVLVPSSASCRLARGCVLLWFPAEVTSR